MNRALALAVLLIAALTATSAQAASPRHCGTVAGFQLVVHRGSGCSEARRVVRAFRAAERKSATVDGWQCESATGGGGCIRGGSSTSDARGWIEWFYAPTPTQPAVSISVSPRPLITDAPFTIDIAGHLPAGEYSVSFMAEPAVNCVSEGEEEFLGNEEEWATLPLDVEWTQLSLQPGQYNIFARISRESYERAPDGTGEGTARVLTHVKTVGECVTVVE